MNLGAELSTKISEEILKMDCGVITILSRLLRRHAIYLIEVFIEHTKREVVLYERS